MLKSLQDPTNPNTSHKPNPSSNKTTFADVAGCDEAKIELEDISDFLKNPKRYHEMGAKVPRGVLLTGPSGCGKTLLARALAGEAADGVFISSGGSDFVEMLVGRGAARVRELFQRARREGRESANTREGRRSGAVNDFLQKLGVPVPTLRNSNKPVKSAIIFIDEIDALAKTRGNFNSNDEREQTLNQLLTEMDGFENRDTDDEEYVNVVVVAATNRPEILDPALLRPGRFDRIVRVSPPSEEGRFQVLKLHSSRVRSRLTGDQWRRVAAAETVGFTGAELANVINESAMLAVRGGKRWVGYEEVVTAAKRCEAGRSITTKQLF